MLQISSKKFFRSDKLHETLHRGVYFTNYRTFDEAPILTPVGLLLPSTAWIGPTTMTYEIMERIEARPNGPVPGEVVATAGDTMANDFAAIVSFFLNVTCTPDPDLTRRLTAAVHPGLGSSRVPQKFIQRMFDPHVAARPGDGDGLSNSVKQLIALKRNGTRGLCAQFVVSFLARIVSPTMWR